MKKSILTVFTIFTLMFGFNFLIDTREVSASQYCSESLNYNQIISDGGASLTEEEKSSLFSCACNNAYSNYSQCKDAQKFLGSGLNNSDGSVVKVYKYNLATEDNSTTTQYQGKMNELINFIESIINAAVGVIIFILAFGFLWNVTQMGMYSSNPQQRVMCLKRLGDVFGTAFFIGCIPMIMKLLFSIISLL